MSILLASCATKTIVINNSTDVVRLGNNVKGDVYYYNAVTGWTLTKNAQLPEGWYAGPANMTNNY